MKNVNKKIIYFLTLLIIISIPTFFTLKHKVKKYIKAHSIHEHGFWTDSFNEHRFDKGLANAIAVYLTSQNVKDCADFGCGTSAYYVRHLNKQNIYCEGFDGNPNSYNISKGLVNVLDLALSFDLNKKYEYAICLEVGEHIPKEYEKILIDNLHRHNTKGIILSWAIEGQGGRGHVNEQNNQYIKNIFSSLGYKNDIDAENRLRSLANFSHFKRTVMVFKR